MTTGVDVGADLWGQQDDETEPAFEAFSFYLNMGRGKRKVIQVAGELGKSETLMYRWFKDWDWKRRARAWDRAEDTKKLHAHWEQIEAMTKRQAGQMVAMGQVLTAPALAVLKLLRERPDVFYEYFMTTDGDGESVLDFNRFERVLGMVHSSARILPGVLEAERTARGLPPGAVDAEGLEDASRLTLSTTNRADAQRLFAKLNDREVPVLPAAIMGDG